MVKKGVYNAAIILECILWSDPMPEPVRARAQCPSGLDPRLVEYSAFCLFQATPHCRLCAGLLRCRR